MLLHHYPLCVSCRKIRLQLGEHGLDFDLKIERYWEENEAFLNLNPAGSVPVLQDGNYIVIGSYAISEYIEETYGQTNLLGRFPKERIEVRRLVEWFDKKFYAEVTSHVYGERVEYRLKNKSFPDAALIREGVQNLQMHLDYISWLVDQRNWLAGHYLTLADITAAAQLSTLDYFGDVSWNKYPSAKEWYARIKSRPSFQGLLADSIAGYRRADHYSDLDF